MSPADEGLRDKVAAILYDKGLRSGDHAIYDRAYCAQVADAVLDILESLLTAERERTTKAQHLPAVAEGGGGWGVFCLACSDAAQDYVYPCAQGRDFPPKVLVDAETGSE